jgi:hypothetical protein
MLMVTVRLPPGATLEDAMERLGLAEHEVDLDYGLILVDPGPSLYAMRVSEEAARRVDQPAGPYADPKIEPFGPVRRPPG